MPGLAGAVSALGLLALPAIASPSYFETQAPVDTWSLSIADSTSLATPSTEVSASDTWSLSIADISSLTTYPAQVSQLSLLSVPGGWVEIGIKAFVATNPVAGSDAWMLQWVEDPTSERALDTWDIWRLAWNDATPSISISQTFAATDTWSLGWLDISSVLTGGQILVAPADGWSLQFVDSAAVAATADAVDTWSLSIADSASIDVIQDAKNAADTWLLMWSFETASIGAVADIPIIASDEWRLTHIEVASISALIPAGSVRRTVRARRRTIVVRPT